MLRSHNREGKDTRVVQDLSEKLLATLSYP